MNLSENATKLLSHLKATGGLWSQNAISALYPTPQYIGTLDPNYSDEAKLNAQRLHWQHDVNINGLCNRRPVLGKSEMFTPTDNYSFNTNEAFRELREAGLAKSDNRGYNEYMIYAI